MAWRNTADVVERFVKKGTQLYIEGRIRTRSWDDQNGNKRYSTDIVADTLQLLGRRPDGQNGAPQQGGYQSQGYGQQGGYQAQGYGQQSYAPQQPVQQPAAPQNIADNGPEDDLPF